MDKSIFLNSLTAGKWKKIGIKRRAGVAVPLFSVYSKKSIGSGEIPDLKLLIDWCCNNDLSVIQLLPLNELGFDNSPYNAISTFALEPMYLSLGKLKNVDLKPFRKEIRSLKNEYPSLSSQVNYRIKFRKTEILKKIFLKNDPSGDLKFNEYIELNFHWLKYYCIFKILTELNSGKNWQEWELKYKYIAPLSTEKILQTFKNEVKFYCWVQWQLYEQMKSVKRYAKKKNVLLMGDIPFLVSRNSADVWAYKNYFKLDLSSGAPPDMYFSKGQRWGMPPYNWVNIASDNFSYLIRRLKYAENFYDLYRIDHFVGLFRVWTIDLKTQEESGGLIGKFDPDDESHWAEQGKNILNVMIDCTSMMPCAEDLGTVPACSDKVLHEFGITGIDVQRWQKKFDNRIKFINPENYRVNSAATVSTHDSSSLPAWWETEAGTIDELLFRLSCEKYGITGERYIYIVNNLFDGKLSADGRFHWKKNISGIYEMLNILQLNSQQSAEFVEMYLTSFGEKNIYKEYIGLKNGSELSATTEFIRKSLEKISSSSSVFCINLLMEYLYLDEKILQNYKDRKFRINFPGTVDSNNWSFKIPVSLEELNGLNINEIIKEINLKTERN